MASPSLTSRLYPRGSRVLGSPAKRQSIWFQNRCVLDTVHCILHLPPTFHPMYDDKHMLKIVQHATTSALNNQEATATFLLLRIPNWMENSTNAFHKMCTDNKDVCTILGYVPKIKVRYMPLPYQQSKTPPLPEATWGKRILVVWNKAAREQLIANYPSWFKKIKQDLSPAAIWNFKNAGTTFH